MSKSDKAKIRSKRKQARQQQARQQQQKRPQSPRDLDGHLQEIERRLNAIQEDAVRQSETDSPYYEVPWRLMGRLLAVSTLLTRDVGEFLQSLKQFGELLPGCAAKSVISKAFDQDFSPASGVLQTLYREARWQSFHCPTISLDRELAVSAMLTSYPRDFLDGLLPPWDAFVIRLPKGLIEFDGVAYTDVMVHRFECQVPPLPPGNHPSNVREAREKVERFLANRPSERWGLYGLSGERGYLQGESLLTEHLGLVRREHFIAPEIPDGAPSEGVVALFARLVAGVCALAHPGSTRRTSPDDSLDAVEWQLMSRSPQGATAELETLEKYLNRLRAKEHAMPPSRLSLEELIARYGIPEDTVPGEAP